MIIIESDGSTDGRITLMEWKKGRNICLSALWMELMLIICFAGLFKID